MTILSAMRGGGYKDAVKLADSILCTKVQGATVAEYTDAAVKAFNACGHWARKGKIRLRYEGHLAVIEVLVNGQIKVPGAIQELLLWAEENSVMEFLAKSGIQRTFNTDTNPF